MESDSGQRADAASVHDALGAIGQDRARIGARMTAETWWAAPMQGLGAALLVGGPAIGLQWAWILFAAGSWIFFAVEYFFRRRSGLKISRPAGPRGAALVAVFAALLLAGVTATFILSFSNATAVIVTIAVIVGIIFALCVAWYDRIYAIEVRRVE